jgi:hypothetical protein
MPYNTEEIVEPKCPKCGGKLWDNRETKRNPKQPDFKCRDKQCDGVIWPPRDAAPRTMPQPSSPPVATSGKAPYSSGPAIKGLDDAPVATVTDIPTLDRLFAVYSVCLDHVLAVEVPKLTRAQIGASPESVAAMAATLLIQASKR